MAATDKFKQDMLLKEEAFLRQFQAKLTDQLNRLKVRVFLRFVQAVGTCVIPLYDKFQVEEIALLKKLSSERGGTSQGHKSSKALSSMENYVQVRCMLYSMRFLTRLGIQRHRPFMLKWRRVLLSVLYLQLVIMNKLIWFTDEIRSCSN